MGYLINTCIWVDVERGALAPADVMSVTGDAPVFLSPVTIAELYFGAEIAHEAGIRQKRLAALQRLQRKPMLTYRWGNRRNLRSAGRCYQSGGQTPSLPGPGFVAGEPGDSAWFPVHHTQRAGLQEYFWAGTRGHAFNNSLISRCPLCTLEYMNNAIARGCMPKPG